MKNTQHADTKKDFDFVFEELELLRDIVYDLKSSIDELNKEKENCTEIKEMMTSLKKLIDINADLAQAVKNSSEAARNISQSNDNITTAFGQLVLHDDKTAIFSKIKEPNEGKS